MAVKLSPRSRQILEMCSTPRRYTELKRKLELSDRGLYVKLKRFQRNGWLKKLPDGKYALTDEGKGVLENIRLQEALKILGEEDEFVKKLRIEVERRASLIAIYRALYIWHLYFDMFRDYSFNIYDSLPAQVEKKIYFLEEELKKNKINVEEIKKKYRETMNTYIDDIRSSGSLDRWPITRFDIFNELPIHFLDEVITYLKMIDFNLFSLEFSKELREACDLIKEIIMKCIERLPSVPGLSEWKKEFRERLKKHYKKELEELFF